MIRKWVCAAAVLAAGTGVYGISRVVSGQGSGASAGSGVAKVEVPIPSRPVKGKIVPPKELDGMKAVAESNAHLIMQVTLPAVTLPENMLRMTPEQRLEWYNAWEKTEAGRVHALARVERRQIRSLDTPLRKDGVFTFREMRPGKAFVEVEFYASTTAGEPDHQKLLQVAAYELNVLALAGRELMTVDVGPLQARKLETINAGQHAPNVVYEMQKGSGQLADFKGKVVVLDFWGAWCPSCMEQLPELRQIQAKFGNDPRFAMVSLSDGDQREDWEFTIKKEKMTWTQAKITVTTLLHLHNRPYIPGRIYFPQCPRSYA